MLKALLKIVLVLMGTALLALLAQLLSQPDDAGGVDRQLWSD